MNMIDIIELLVLTANTVFFVAAFFGKRKTKKVLYKEGKEQKALLYREIDLERERNEKSVLSSNGLTVKRSNAGFWERI